MSGKVMSYLPLLALPLLVGGWVVVNGTLRTCPMCTSIMDAVTGRGSADAEATESSANQSAALGEPVYGLSAQSLKGETVSLKQFAGKPMLIDFWATWCPPCRQQREILAGMQKELDGNVTVVAVSVDDSATDALKYVNQKGAIGQELYVSSDLQKRFNVASIPTLVFVDAEGRVHEVESGVHRAKEIRAKLEKLGGAELARAQ